MDLIKEQELLIKLCIDNTYRSFFFKDKGFNSFNLTQNKFTPSEISAFGSLQERPFIFQLDAINNMFYSTYESNLELIFEAIPNARPVFKKYAEQYPFKIENKIEDLLRFITFISTEVGGEIQLESTAKEFFLLDLIRFYQGILIATLRRTRYLDYLDYKKSLKSSKKNHFLIINPTLYLSKFKFSINTIQSKKISTITEKNIGKKMHTLLFYYKPDETEVSISTATKKLVNILSNIQNNSHSYLSYIQRYPKDIVHKNLSLLIENKIVF